MNRSGGAILEAAGLLWSWSEQVDATHAQPGVIEKMRALATEVRAEYSRLAASPSAQLDAMIKAWALRELAALPRGPAREWIDTGTAPTVIELALAALPEPVAALVREHVADDEEATTAMLRAWAKECGI